MTLVNPARERLARGELAIGLGIRLVRGIEIAKILKTSGYDWMFIDLEHGAMSLDQLWSARPVLGNAAYRGPITGLYMCGAGTHPGGGVTGAPGHNAAQAILADRSPIRRLFRAR